MNNRRTKKKNNTRTRTKQKQKKKKKTKKLTQILDAGVFRSREQYKRSAHPLQHTTEIPNTKIQKRKICKFS
jgi:hypothetical protein